MYANSPAHYSNKMNKDRLKSPFFLLSITLITITGFSSCSDDFTVFIQNTNEHWESVDICMIRSENDKHLFDSGPCKLASGDSLIWKESINRTDTNTYYAKTFDIDELTGGKEFYIVYKITVNGENLTTGNFNTNHLTDYTLIRMKNNGAAFDLLEYSTDDIRKIPYKTIIADQKTSSFLK